MSQEIVRGRERKAIDLVEVFALPQRRKTNILQKRLIVAPQHKQQAQLIDRVSPQVRKQRGELSLLFGLAQNYKFLELIENEH